MRARVVLAFVSRELKTVFSDKATIFWIVAWPLLWMFLVAYIFVPPTYGVAVQLNVGVIDYDASSSGDRNFTSADFIELLREAEYEGTKLFRVQIYENEAALREDLVEGRLDAGIVIPRGFSYNLTWSSANLVVLVGARDPHTGSISRGIISGFLSEFSRRVGVAKASYTIKYVELSLNATDVGVDEEVLRRYAKLYLVGIATPINASYEDVKPEVLLRRETVVGWTIIGAVGMMFLYSGFSYGASALLAERERGSLRRILASPVSEGELIAAFMLSGVCVQAISGLIALAIGAPLTGAKIVFNALNPLHWLVPLLIVVGALMSIGIGLILSLMAKTSQGANGLGMALGLLLSFTAGIWFPRTMLPWPLSLLPDYFPVTWVFDAIRSILVFGRELSEVWIELLKIAAAATLILAADVVIYKRALRKYAES